MFRRGGTVSSSFRSCQKQPEMKFEITNFRGKIFRTDFRGKNFLSGITRSGRSQAGFAGGSSSRPSRRQASSTDSSYFPCANPAMTVELQFMTGKCLSRTDFIVVTKTSLHIPSFRKMPEM
jgi:hypothetical protein